MARAPLSDLQYAYLLGELGGGWLGGPALFFEEYTCERLDPITFSRALYQLMWRHEMLRTTFDASGTLRVHSDLPVPLSYQSLRGLPEYACQETLQASRDECYRQATPLMNAAPFAIKVFALDDRTIVQVIGRLLAMDGFSGEIFAQDLGALLAGEALPPLRYTFREYRVDAERRKALPEYASARAYWLKRLDSLPAAPQLPQPRNPCDPGRRLKRRVFTMPDRLWRSLAGTIERNRLTPTVAIGAAFCEVLRRWARSPNFTINLLYGERSRMHPDVSKVIGNFTSSVLLECAPGPHADTFLDRARNWGKQLTSDLRNSAFSGSSVIRELNQCADTPDVSMPVVFTSLLNTKAECSRDNGAGAFLDRLGWQRLQGALCAPQVSLNHQVHVANNRLVVQWDTADDMFAPGVIDEMFAAYNVLLNLLATSDSA